MLDEVDVTGDWEVEIVQKIGKMAHQLYNTLWGLSKTKVLFISTRVQFITVACCRECNANCNVQTSFTSTNVKLRLRFYVHLTFIWHSPEPHLSLNLTWPPSNIPLTITRPLPNLYWKILNFVQFLWHSPDIYLTFTWHLPDHLTIIWPSPDLVRV